MFALPRKLAPWSWEGLNGPGKSNHNHEWGQSTHWRRHETGSTVSMPIHSWQVHFLMCVVYVYLLADKHSMFAQQDNIRKIISQKREHFVFSKLSPHKKISPCWLPSVLNANTTKHKFEGERNLKAFGSQISSNCALLFALWKQKEFWSCYFDAFEKGAIRADRGSGLMRPLLMLTHHGCYPWMLPPPWMLPATDVTFPHECYPLWMDRCFPHGC